jgi:hypothetical protein
MEKETKQRPVHKIKLPVGGSILWVAIWKHQNSDGRSGFSVSFSRSYRENGNEKKYVATQFYHRDHLLGLARAMEVAHAWIVTNDRKEAANAQEAK